MLLWLMNCGFERYVNRKRVDRRHCRLIRTRFFLLFFVFASIPKEGVGVGAGLCCTLLALPSYQNTRNTHIRQIINCLVTTSINAHFAEHRRVHLIFSSHCARTIEQWRRLFRPDENGKLHCHRASSPEMRSTVCHSMRINE